MKRIAFFASFVGALFLLAGASYFFLLHFTKASAAITNVRTENIMGPGAQVKWDTDMPSDSRVAYGASDASLSLSYSFALFSNSRCDAGGYVVNHCINLTGLSANTVYYYRVESLDTSGTDSFLGGFHFTSTVRDADTIAPSAPSGLVATPSSSSQINLSWTASTDNVGVVGYKIYRGSVQIGTATATSYSDMLLSSGVSYPYAVLAYDAAGNVSAQSTMVTAATLLDTAISRTAINTADMTPPVITSVRVENIIGPGAQIKWSTDVLSNSLVQFSTVSGALVSNSTWRCDDGGNVTNHCINLTNLVSGAQYYYQVISKNASGYETRSLENSFVSGSAITIALVAVPVPVIFSVDLGTPRCDGGHVVAPVSFIVDPSDGGYFVVNDRQISSTTIELLSGTYYNRWNGIPNTGYAVSGISDGTFTIPNLDTCSIATAAIATPTTTAAITPAVTQENPTNTLLASNIIPSPATSSSTTHTNTPVAVAYSRSVASQAIPNHSDEPIITEIPQLANYQDTEVLMRQKYQEAEQIYRKENKVPSGRIMAEAEKRNIVEEIHAQFPDLVPAADSVLLGTTTFSRITEPDHIVAEVSRVIAERIKTPILFDTDGDGISDYDEVHIYGTDPHKADTDGDGIKDGDEILAGTDPLKKLVAPLPYENPKEVVLAAKTDSKIFSVEKVELTADVDSVGATSTVKSRVALSGTGLPNSFVTIYIFSTPVVVTVKTDSDGKWKYTMDKELENGKHEVYVAMTESAGKIIVKSDPIPFVKTAQAVTLQSGFALANTAVESPSGFFRGGILTLSLVILFIILGLSFMIISFVSKKREISDDLNV